MTKRSDDLSAKERALWLFQQYAPDTGVLNVAFAVRSTDRFKPDVLQQAVSHVVRRHPALRTVFPAADGVARRVVLAADDERAQALLWFRASTTSRIAEDLRRFGARAFELGEELPIRVAHFVVDAFDVLCVSVHHVVYDARSASILRRELMLTYRGLLDTGEVPPALRDEVVPERASPTPDAEHLAFWREHLAGAQAARGDLHIGRPGTRLPHFPGSEIDMPLSPEAVAALEELQRRLRMVPAILMFGVYNVLLSRHGIGTDVVVALPVDARGLPPHEALGYYVNFVTLHNRVDPSMTFSEFIRSSRDTYLAGLLHSAVPIDDVFDSSFERSLADERPLVRHIFNYVAGFNDAEFGQGWHAQPRMEPVPLAHSRADLTLVIMRMHGQLYCNAIYATDVFTRDEVAALLRRYDLLLQACASAPDTPIGELSLWTAQDKAIVAQPSATAPEPVLAALQRQAAGTPAFAGVSYGQLLTQAATFADVLRRNGVGQGDVVGVGVGQRDVVGVGVGQGDVVGVQTGLAADRIAALLAAWSCGASVLALDVAAGNAVDTVEAAEVCLLVGDDLPDDLAEAVAVIPLPRSAAAGVSTDLTPPPAGTTALLIPADDGNGFLHIGHELLASMVAGVREGLRIAPGEQCLWLCSPGLGAPWLEPLAALTAGACLRVGDPQARSDGLLLAAAFQEGVDVAGLSPLCLARLVDARLATPDLPHTRVRVVCAAERLPQWLADKASRVGVDLLRLIPLAALGGPALVSQLGDTSGDPAGRPLSAVEAIVMDPVRASASALPGIRGELHLTLPGRGAPVGTGRVGAWGFDGTVRLEPQTPVSDLEDDPRLRWVCAAAGHIYAELREPGPSRILLHPAVGRIVVTAALPTRPDGSVDLGALPAIAAAAAREEEIMPAPVAPPAANVESFTTELADLWRRLLGQPGLGVDADFFANGGSSILAARVVSYVKKATGVRLALRTIFRHCTPAKLAAEVMAARPSE